MKKTFSIFMFCISLLLFPSALVRADGGSLIPSDNEVIVTPSVSQTDIDNANSVGYLFELLRQGASIDCTNAEDGYDLDDLVDDFYTNIWNGWRDLTGTTDTVYWLNPFSDDLIHSQSVMYVKPNDQLYKTVKPLRDWLNLPRNEVVPVEPTPTPPVDYTDKVNTILSDYVGYYGVGLIHYFDYPCYWQNNDNYPLSQNVPVSLFARDYDFNTLNSYYNWIFFSYGIADVNYDTSTGNMTVSNFNTADPYTYAPFGSIEYASGFVQMSLNTNRGWYNSTNNMLPTYYYITDHIWQTHFNNVSAFIDYCYMHFRHINIYVDGEPWGMVGTETHSVSIGGGTYVETSNQPVEYTYDIDIYIPLDDIIDRLDTLIRQKQVITYPDISDLIVDVNGQPAVAVIDVSHETVDDWYVKNVLEYIPIFPLSVSYPVSDSEMVSIIEPAVSVIPDDIITVLGILFIGGLFVCLMQRLLE